MDKSQKNNYEWKKSDQKEKTACCILHSYETVENEIL